MTTIKTRVNFCVPKDQTWIGLGQDHDADIAELARNPRGTVGAWLIRTYLELKRLGRDVQISESSLPDCINVTDAFTFGRRKRLNTHFLVVARSDGPMPALANFTIHQNGLIAPSATSANLPHWPQPGLIPRDPSRGQSLSRLTFKGEPWSLDSRFRDSQFLAALRSIGITLDIPDENRHSNTSTWLDYRTSDAVIAVRNLTERDAAIKPASKLINAWIAGVPALLGPEPAFRELRTNPLDYIELTSPNQALQALRQLRDDPPRYAAMIANGVKRAEDFSPDRIARQWSTLLDGPILAAFDRWQKTNPALRWLRVTAMHFQVDRHRKNHRENIQLGQRILSALAQPD